MSKSEQPSRLDQLQQQESSLDASLAKARSHVSMLENGEIPFRSEANNPARHSGVEAASVSDRLAQVRERLSAYAIPYLEAQRRVVGLEREEYEVEERLERIRAEKENAASDFKQIKEEQKADQEKKRAESKVFTVVDLEEKRERADDVSPRVGFSLSERVVEYGGKQYIFQPQSTTWDVMAHLFEHAGDLIDEEELKRIERENRRHLITTGSVQEGVNMIRTLIEEHPEDPQLLLEIPDDDKNYFYLEPHVVRSLDDEALLREWEEEITATSPIEDDPGLDEIPASRYTGVYRAIEILITEADTPVETILEAIGPDEYGYLPSTIAARNRITEAIDALRLGNRQGELSEEMIDLLMQWDDYIDFRNLLKKSSLQSWLAQRIPTTAETDEARIRELARDRSKHFVTRESTIDAFELVLKSMAGRAQIGRNDVFEAWNRQNDEDNGKKKRLTWSNARYSMGRSLSILENHVLGGVASPSELAIARQMGELLGIADSYEAVRAFREQDKLNTWFKDPEASSSVSTQGEIVSPVTEEKRDPTGEQRETSADTNEVILYERQSQRELTLEERDLGIREAAREYLDLYTPSQFPPRISSRDLSRIVPGLGNFMEDLHKRRLPNLRMDDKGRAAGADAHVIMLLARYKGSKDIPLNKDTVREIRRILTEVENEQKDS